MATKTLARRDEAVARPIEPAGVKSGYTNGWWAVRGNQVELHFDCEENIEAAAVAITEIGFEGEINREIAKIAALPPFANLRSLRTRIAESEQTIRDNEAKIATLRSGLGPNASDKEVSMAAKEIENSNARIREATLQGENARRFTGDAFAECERLARASLPAITELFQNRAEKFVAQIGDEFWAVARDFFVKMSIAENQTALVNGYLQQVMSRVDLILEPGGWEAEMVRLSCAIR